jgi:hypothetical protein
MTTARGAPGHGWCSLRIRFDERELTLLKGAEHARGASLAHNPRPDMLRTALALSKAGQKLRHASPGASLTFEGPERQLLLEAVRLANGEIHWAIAQRDSGAVDRKQTSGRLPGLVERGVAQLWPDARAGRLIQRLDVALRSM